MPPSVYNVLEAAGSDSQPQFLEFDTGIVCYAIPALNAYYVIPSQNMGGAGDPIMNVAFAMNGSALKYGATVSEYYQPGTCVLIAKTGAAAHAGTPEARRFLVIVGSIPKDAILDPTTFPTRSIMPGVGIDYETNPFANSLKAAREISTIITDRSYGRHIEALAGDWAVINDFMNYILMGQNYVGIGALRARIEAHSIQNKLKLTADDLRIEGLGSESADRPDLKELLLYSRRARTILEGMGSTSATPVVADDLGDFEPIEKDQQGIFRHEDYEGELVDGIWKTTKLPPALEAVRTWEEDKPELGLTSEQLQYDGLYERRGANQVSSVKSPYVPVVRALMPEEENEDPFPDEEEGTSWQEKEGISDEDYPNIAPANSTDEFDHNTAEYWRKRLRSRTDNWKVYTPEEVKDEYGLDMDRRKEIPGLDETEHDYPIPEVVEIEDPATGKKYKYYAAESFIKQLPDGSISISDGYGAEIRMVKGRIIISAATDIEQRPGRDIVNMAGRHLVNNAGDSLFMQASNGSIYSKAEKDYRILAGNSGEGTLTIESRGKAEADPNSNDPEKRVDGGIVMKSSSNIGIVGKDMYIGVYDKDDASPNGLKRTKSGTIIIDSCGGVLGMLGSSMYSNFKTNISMTCTAGNGSGLSLGSARIGLFATSLDLGTGNCLINVPSSGSVAVKTLGASGVVSENISVTGRPILSVGGNIQALTGIMAGGSMGAASMSAGRGSFGGASKHYSHKGGSTPTISIPALDSSALKAAGESFEEKVGGASDTLYKGANLQGTGFVYPTGGDMRVSSDYKMYAARWQNMIPVEESKAWDEKMVKSPDGASESYIYPGKAHWERKSFFMGVNNGVILKDEYVINTTQED